MGHRNHFPREFYVPKGAIKIADKQSSAVAYLYDGRTNGKPAAVCFAGKADKPSSNFVFRDTARREQFVKQHFENIRDWERRREMRRTERKAYAHNVQVGDIYRTCWGYDQTNVEFFEVVEVKGKYAILREIASASRDDGYGSECCVPQSGAYLEPRYKGDDRGLPIRRLIQERHIKIDDVRSAWPWGTRTVGGIVVGGSCSRTASGWGH